MNRRYLQVVERNANEINLGWKVGHSLIFFMIAIASVGAIHGMNNIFETFNYRCVLYARPYFVLREVTHLGSTPGIDQLTLDSNNTLDNNTALLANETNIEIVTKANRVAIRQQVVVSDKENDFQDYENDDVDVNAPIIHVENVGLNGAEIIMLNAIDWSAAFKIPSTNHMYVFNDEMWFKNETVIGRVQIRIFKTVFATMYFCDYALMIPLVSLMVSTILAVMIVLCGRGGGGYASDIVLQPWRHVYVTLITSSVMALLSIVACNITIQGLNQYCHTFKPYTGLERCNKFINYFAVHQELGLRRFKMDYTICYYSYLAAAVLWVAQLVLTLARIIVMVDFQFNTIFVNLKKQDSPEDDVEEGAKVPKPLGTKLYKAFKQLRKSQVASKVA